MITYREITTGDPEYGAEKDLRNKVLRRPLGLELHEKDLRDEDTQVHIVALDDREQVVGCVLVAFVENTARMRQMAVAESFQGRGIGTELVVLAERAARRRIRNIRSIVLHARLTALGFYERLGYRATSEIFTEVTIPHVEMVKDLEAAAAEEP